jgi:hypothetical protein
MTAPDERGCAMTDRYRPLTAAAVLLVAAIAAVVSYMHVATLALACVPAILEVPQGRSLKFPTWLSGQRVVSEASGCRA